MPGKTSAAAAGPPDAGFVSTALRFGAKWGTAAALLAAGGATDAEPLRLQLKWRHQFQFAGYYAAQSQGYYAAEGLEVQILEGGPSHPPISGVLDGNAEFGVGDAEVLLARLRGAPLVVCAAVFQHSPYVLMSLRERGLRTPADLVGTRIMLSDDQGAAQVRAMLVHEGIDPRRVAVLPQSWQLDDLLARRVDAMSAYATVEPARLLLRGAEPELLRAVDYGVDFYGDTLFTTEARARARPEQVAAFRRASLRGWAYALEHADELAGDIGTLPGVAERGITQAILAQEARDMRPYILPDVVEIGHMNPGRWQRIAHTFVEVGLAPSEDRLAGLVLETQAVNGDSVQARWVLWPTLGALALAGVVLLWNVQVRRRVRDRTRELGAEVAQRQHAEALLVGQRRVLEMIGLGAPLRDTLEALLRLVEQQAPELVTSIQLVERDGVHVRPGASPRLSERLTHAAAAAATAEGREPVAILDIASDPRAAAYRELAAAEGLRASWSLPIFDAQRAVLGAFVLYLRQRGRPAPEQLALAETATQTAAIAIGRKREEEELRAGRQRLVSIYDTVGDTIFLVALEADGGFRFVSVNKRFVTTTGLPAEAVVGKRVEEVIPAGSLGLVLERYRLAVRDKLVVRWEETSDYPVGRLTGEVSVAPVLDERGECTHLVGAVHDITARKAAEQRHVQAEEMLRQSQKLESIGRLAGGVAHDFNNILGVILGYGGLMRAQLGQAHPARPRLEQVIQAAYRASGLTRQLLAFSRKQVMQPQLLELGSVVSDLRPMLERVVGEDLEIVVRAGARQGAVQADPTQVEQVIMNLVVNARDAMPQGGRLTIETASVELDASYAAAHPPAQAGSFVVLAVTDTGTGMDAETRRRIFEPFFTTKAPGEGTGLGLATVYGIVNQMAGHIWVYSEVGRGTCFKVYLPRVDAPAPQTEVVAEAPALGGDETVLVVEDNESLRGLVAEMLADQGYKVLTVTQGEEALQLVEGGRHAIDLVLTDVVMPKLGGAELVKRLRALRPEMCFVYMSGYASGAMRQGMLDQGAVFIEKPFSADQLARTLRQALERRAAPAPRAPR